MMNRVRESHAFFVTTKTDRAEAKSTLFECIKTAQNLDDREHVAFTLARLLSLSLDDENMSEAHQYVSEIERQNVSDPHDLRWGFVQRVLARYHLKSKNIEKSIKCANDSVSIFDKMGLKKEAGKSFEIVVQAYEEIGDLASALSASKQMTKLIQ